MIFMTDNTNIWLNGIMGVVVGDALGCPVQFESRDEVARHPVTGMRGYGTFNLPEGSWTESWDIRSPLFCGPRSREACQPEEFSLSPSE